MTLDIISYSDLLESTNTALQKLENALLNKGIVGICGVPEFESKTRAYIHAARNFSALSDAIKQQYVPNRDEGKTEGYELGAEWFQTENGDWQIDDKKASFYAFVPDHHKNIWPVEVNLKSSYLELGSLIFNIGKLVLNVIGLNEQVGLKHDHLIGYGRMLHYHKESDTMNINPNWCGEHFDHGLFTGLIPAYYFCNDKEVDEPDDAGLFIKPNNGSSYEKINASDKSVLLFQVGEFGQLISNDRIKATKHKVKKTNSEIERFSFALFYSADENLIIQSVSELTKDARFIKNKFDDENISYGKWEKASYDRYRVK
jgi:isopenicillin N synthase-like dioxygenase